MLRQGTRIQTGVKQSLRVDPGVVLSSNILQLSQFELEQAIEMEIQENPALDRIDDFASPVEMHEILKRVAPQELSSTSESREFHRSMPQDSLSDHDWVDLACSTDSLCDHLMGQLKVSLEAKLWPVAEYFVGSVNDRGYLLTSVEEAALDCNVSLEDAEEALSALRQCEPAGVGASGLQDCLTLQLRDASTPAERLARSILKKNWEDLVAKNASAIMRHYKADRELVQEAFDVILSLNPFPGESFSNSSKSSAEPAHQVRPDVVVTLDEIGWLIEVPGPSPISLRINRGYAKYRDQISDRSGQDAEKRHIVEYINRAERFIEALGHRRQQLAKIGKYLVESQGGFVKTGEYKFLMPLTRSTVAKELGIHESTVSRATSGKFIQIATREVVPFDVFFKPALRVQKMIEEILESENPDSPLSDEMIAQILARKGVKVARRTVNKYRDRTKLLSSRLRKMA